MVRNEQWHPHPLKDLPQRVDLQLVISLKRERGQGDRAADGRKSGKLAKIAVKHLSGIQERMLNDIGVTRMMC